MDAAETFIREFIAKEHEALRAKYGEPNAVFVPRLQAVNALFARDVTTRSGISRGSSADLDALRARQSSIVPRRVLAAHEYLHPSLGPLFELELSGTERGEEDAASARYYVRSGEGGMRIISYDVACHDCAGTGQACARCAGTGWVHADGVRLGSPGTRVRSTRGM